jgi:hypothetical protein
MTCAAQSARRRREATTPAHQRLGERQRAAADDGAKDHDQILGHNAARQRAEAVEHAPRPGLRGADHVRRARDEVGCVAIGGEIARCDRRVVGAAGIGIDERACDQVEPPARREPGLDDALAALRQRHIVAGGDEQQFAARHRDELAQCAPMPRLRSLQLSRTRCGSA